MFLTSKRCNQNLYRSAYPSTFFRKYISFLFATMAYWKPISCKLGTNLTSDESFWLRWVNISVKTPARAKAPAANYLEFQLNDRVRTREVLTDAPSRNYGQTHPAIMCPTVRSFCIQSKKSNGLPLARCGKHVIKWCVCVGHPLSLWKHNQPKSRAARSASAAERGGAPLRKLEIMFPFQQVLKSTGCGIPIYARKHLARFSPIIYLRVCVSAPVCYKFNKVIILRENKRK